MKDLLLSIIIVNYNVPDLLARCLASINRFLAECDKEVIVVDNNSRDESLDELQRMYPDLTVIRLKKNLGFGQANNIGVRRATGRIVLLLNSDTELLDSSLLNAIDQFQSCPAKTLWGLTLVWPDGRFQNSFSQEITFLDFLLIYTPLAGIFRSAEQVKKHKYDGRPFQQIAKVDIVYGTAMLLYREDFLSINGFNDSYFMYFEDIEFCDRFKKQLGGNIYVYPFTTLVHHVQGSSGKKTLNMLYLKSKYIYGSHKFGAWRMPLVMLFDIPLLTLQYLYMRLSGRR